MNERYAIVYTRTGALDLKERIEYIRYELKEPQTAKKWYVKIKKEVGKLSEMPTRFPLVADEYLGSLGIRLLTVGNYLIFYRIEESEDKVFILRVLSGRRNWRQLLRLPDEITEQ